MIVEMFGKRCMEKEDFETRIIVGEPHKGKLKVVEDSIELEWKKNMKKQMDQLQAAMKKHGPNYNFIDLDLEEAEPLPPKFKIPDIKKYMMGQKTLTYISDSMLLL